MAVDKNEFFRQATLKICGSLKIEKAMHNCLLFMRNFIPAGQMSFHIYHRGTGIVETVAMATPDNGRAMRLKTALPSEVRRLVIETEKETPSRVWLFNRMADNEIVEPIAKKLKVQELSGMVMDLLIEGDELGSLMVTGDGEKEITPEHAELLALLREPFSVALTNSLRYRELQLMKDMLADDNVYLQDELRRLSGEEIVGADFGLKGVMEMVRQVAALSSPVLLLGETGTGKEVIANAIHYSSPRSNGPFIKVNCGAIPETLMDSELFGHEKGAFSGAIYQKRGRFERAHNGTIFLDEIGELPQEAQVRLLRVLQEKEIERVGGTEPIHVDIRVIAATHRDLEGMLVQGDFREDLYYRLRVFPVIIPPLRKRKGDIPALIHYFIQKKSREMKLTEIPALAPGAVDRLINYPWPGNVRELENAVEHALILCRNKPLEFSQAGMPSDQPSLDRKMPAGDPQKLNDLIARHIREVLDMCSGRVEGEKGAAQILDINPSTLRVKMRKLGIPFGRKYKTS